MRNTIKWSNRRKLEQARQKREEWERKKKQEDEAKQEQEAMKVKHAEEERLRRVEQQQKKKAEDNSPKIEKEELVMEKEQKKKNAEKKQAVRDSPSNEEKKTIKRKDKPCWRFIRGKCHFGSRCRWKHAVSDKSKLLHDTKIPALQRKPIPSSSMISVHYPLRTLSPFNQQPVPVVLKPSYNGLSEQLAGIQPGSLLPGSMGPMKRLREYDTSDTSQGLMGYANGASNPVWNSSEANEGWTSNSQSWRGSARFRQQSAKRMRSGRFSCFLLNPVNDIKKQGT